MWTRIGKLLQIGQGDRLMILVLLLQAFCTGVFTAALELGAITVFLESEGGKALPGALLISGAAGILIATIYSYFNRQMRTRSYGILNIVVVVLAMLLLVIVFEILGMGTHDIAFSLFVFSGPLILITLLGFWTTARGFLDPGRGKLLRGLIEVALVGGMLLAFLITPELVRLGLAMKYMLYAGTASLVIASIAQLYVLSGHESQSSPFRNRITIAGPFKLFSHRYTALMASYVTVGVAVALLIHFSFLSFAGEGIASDGKRLQFLGYFFALAVLLGWMMKRFLFDWSKRVFGLWMTLLITPALLLVISILMAIFGEVYEGGIEVHYFTFVFLLVVVSKLGSLSMKESMENPSMNLIYQSLDPRERYNVQSGIEVVLSQIGVFLAGLFLFLFMHMQNQDEGTVTHVTNLTYALYVLLIIWIYLGINLYRSYHKMLTLTLESDRILDPVDLGLKEIVKFDLNNTIFPGELLSFNPFFFHYSSWDYKVLLLSHPRPEVRRITWDHFMGSSPGIPELTISQLLVVESEPEIKAKIRELRQRKLKSRLDLQGAFIRERLNMFRASKEEPDDAIGDAFHSGDKNEILAAMYHVAEERDLRYLQEVVSLFRNRDAHIQSVAISTAGWIDVQSNGLKIIDFLDHPQLYAIAWSALVRQGDRVLDELETAFNKPDSSIILQKRIVSVISAIGDDRAIKSLVQKLDSQHRDLFHAVVYALYENKFQAPELQLSVIESAILRMVDAGTWAMAAKVSVRADNPGGHLAAIIDQEIWEINELILMLLAMIYDRRSVRRIRVTLLDRQSDDRGMAIELLELMLRGPLKLVLVSYFHDVSVRNKIDKLKERSPVELLPTEVLLKRILNRSAAQAGDFIRICVLDLMGSSDRFFDEQQIMAQGFHPNPSIRAMTSELLRKNSPEHYQLVTERLDSPDNVFPEHKDISRWYLDTTMRLTSWTLFANVGINSLFKLVSKARPFSGDIPVSDDTVTLARSVSTEEYDSLSGGIAIISAFEPDILEQIRYLGTIGACEAFLFDRKEFIELLFDDRSLLHVFCNVLNQS